MELEKHLQSTLRCSYLVMLCCKCFKQIGFHLQLLKHFLCLCFTSLFSFLFRKSVLHLYFQRSDLSGLVVGEVIVTQPNAQRRPLELCSYQSVKLQSGTKTGPLLTLKLHLKTSTRPINDCNGVQSQSDSVRSRTTSHLQY